MLVDLILALAPEAEVSRVKERFDDIFTDDESPYHESPYRD
jgi:hypothetical protein